MLYSPERHEALKPLEWNATKVEQTIRHIVELALRDQDIGTGAWPLHPNDTVPGGELTFQTDFYMGAAGVVWALQELRDVHPAASAYDPAKSLRRILESHMKLRDHPAYQVSGSYFVGEAGVRFVNELAAPSRENREVLIQLMFQNLENEYREILYGAPGTLLMAHFLYERFGKDSEGIYHKAIRNVLESMVPCGVDGFGLWDQHLGPTPRKLYGAAHGAVGIYGALLMSAQSSKLLNRKSLVQQASQFLKATATIEGDMCNWPAAEVLADEKPRFLVQWCHGAMGFITSLSSFIEVGESETIDSLLLKAGNLVFEAGPLAKGSNLCHGTGGSGAALLKLFTRTGDPKWLGHAQKFAMHAIDQFEAELEKVGHARFSLWTGDLGLAIFLRDLLRHKTRMPGVEFV